MYHIDVYDDIIRVKKTEENVTQNVGSYLTVADFIAAMSDSCFTCTPILSDAIKYMRAKNKVYVSIFYHKRRVLYKQLDINGNTNKFDIEIPNTIISTILSLSGDKLSLLTSKIYFVEDDLITEYTKLYKPSFPNVFSDSHICFGHIKVGPYPVDNLSGLKGLYDLFFNGVANSDLYQNVSLEDGRVLATPTSLCNYLQDSTEEERNKVYFNSNTMVGTLATDFLSARDTITH